MVVAGAECVGDLFCDSKIRISYLPLPASDGKVKTTG